MPSDPESWPPHSPIPGLLERLQSLPPHAVFGQVTAIQGLMAEVGGIDRHLRLGGRCLIEAPGPRLIPCEVVGFRARRALVMPFEPLDGVGTESRVLVDQDQSQISPGPGWMGRVLDGLGRPADGRGPLPPGPVAMPVRALAPPAGSRRRLGGKLDLGIRVLNAFLTCVEGQRLGIFAGSGVGKSSLLGMIARLSTAEVAVIALIGERGREVQEFIEDILGPEGLARSVVVAATGDEAPLMRRQAAWTAMAVAEAFRAQGRSVLCMMDSLTRFAMAQREIGLSAGEPPTTRGYPPTAFTELAKLLERAGPGRVGEGQMTGLFTVLVDGDDHNEPVADSVRGIVDGHVVLERRIAERGRFPSVNVLKSVSRALPHCNSDAENALIRQARAALATYEDMAELIRLGAYRMGSDPAVDEAIRLYPLIEGFIAQARGEATSLAEGYRALARILGVAWS